MIYNKNLPEKQKSQKILLKQCRLQQFLFEVSSVLNKCNYHLDDTQNWYTSVLHIGIIGTCGNCGKLFTLVALILLPKEDKQCLQQIIL